MTNLRNFKNVLCFIFLFPYDVTIILFSGYFNSTMRSSSFFLTVFSLFFCIPAGYGSERAASIPSTSLSSPVTMLPTLLSQESLEQKKAPVLLHEGTYGKWSILLGQHYGTLLWTDYPSEKKKLPLTLYITPSRHMISIDVIARKKEYREFKLPFITWNIGKISVILNRTRDEKGWVTYSTAIYTQNIDRLIKALENQTPMNLDLSIQHSIPITLQGLNPALLQFKTLIRQNALEAPVPLADPSQKAAETKDTLIAPDGMLPSLVPLYQQAQTYVMQCTALAAQPLEHSQRYDVCMKRNEFLEKMKAQGWCWGSGDPDQHDRDKVWRKCIMTPKGGLTQVEGKVKQDFEKAKSISNE